MLEMNPFIELFRQPEFRQWVSLPFSSLGYGNFAKSLFNAYTRNRDPAKKLPRYILPELWKNLGNRKAVVTASGVVTFSELSERAVRLANSFYHQGIGQNDRVAVLLYNEQGWFDVMAACMISGIKMPMLNTHLNPDELVKCINDAKPKALVFSSDFVDIVASIRDRLKNIELLVCAGAESESSKSNSSYASLESLLSNGDLTLEKGGFGLPQVPFSGGSTGVPKLIVDGGNKEVEKRRQKGVSEKDLKKLKAKMVHSVALVGPGKIKEQVVSLIPGPLYHAGVQVAVFPLFYGGTVVPMRKFNAESFLALIEQEKVNFTFVAPTMLERVLKLPEEIQRRYDLSSMQVLFCAAAPCAHYVKTGINDLFRRQGAKVDVFHEYYGSSEAAVISVLEPKDYEAKPQRYKSVGKIIGCECLVYNVDEKRPCAVGEEGHVLIRSARMYSVNYGNSGDMDNAFIEIDGVYWFDDGCIGRLDEDGFLYLSSRSKDMIISGGVNIFPVEIEEVIRKHDNILDVAVIKVEDADLGEVPGALIQTLNGDTIPAADLIEFCKANGLYGYKLPKHLGFIEALPKNTAGKIRKKDLEKEFKNSTPINLSQAGETLIEAETNQ